MVYLFYSYLKPKDINVSSISQMKIPPKVHTNKYKHVYLKFFLPSISHLTRFMLWPFEGNPNLEFSTRGLSYLVLYKVVKTSSISPATKAKCYLSISINNQLMYYTVYQPQSYFYTRITTLILKAHFTDDHVIYCVMHVQVPSSHGLIRQPNCCSGEIVSFTISDYSLPTKSSDFFFSNLTNKFCQKKG